MSSAGSTLLDMDAVGYNPAFFVGTIDDGLICVICQNVVEDAAELPCGHLFCAVHIRSWLTRGKKNCPVCRLACGEHIKTGHELHLTYRRQLSELRTRCPNNGRGCAKIVHPKDLKAHFATCDHAPAFCKWETCPYHFKGEAQRSSPLQQKDLAEHERTCEHRVVPCELYGCGEVVPFSKLAAHHQSCSQTQVVCTIRGCEQRMLRGNLQSHLEDVTAMPRHMTLLSTEVARLTTTLDRPEVIHNDELVFRVTDIGRRFSSPSFRFETRLYTLGVIGRYGYNFRVQLRKREWPDDRKRFNDKLGIYLHVEQGEIDDILEWPFPFVYTFTILDQSRDPSHIEFTVTDGSTRGADWLGPGSGKGWGPQGMASFDQLRTRSYVRNDSIYVKVSFSRT